MSFTREDLKELYVAGWADGAANGATPLPEIEEWFDSQYKLWRAGKRTQPKALEFGADAVPLPFGQKDD